MEEDARNQASQGQTGVSFVGALSGVVRGKSIKVGRLGLGKSQKA